ncbi:MAG: hypothetical protein AUI17_05070 [Acidobacteriales bacterium 13_2_20CM_2_55_5]|nr:MAG: hypothetical protein AUI17_05070 [Acidobacteriales bacterium 13_2_20CM_2_55_5]
MFVQGAIGFNRGAEIVVRPDQRQRGCGGKQFGVRSGREQLVRILREKSFAVRKRYNLYTPEATSKVGLGKDGSNPLFDYLLRNSLELCRQQQTKDR